MAVARAARKNWPHAAFNPETGLLYANTMHVGRMYKHLETKPHVVGQRYMYMENLPMPRPARPADRPHRSDRSAHRREEMARAAARTIQIWSAMLATGGGLLFTGKETGEFIALDADTGKTLWQFQTGSGINAHAGHLHAQGQAVRHGAVRHRRAVLEHQRASS